MYARKEITTDDPQVPGHWWHEEQDIRVSLFSNSRESNG